MFDLSHWDFEDVFTLSEVSALIAGKDPKPGVKVGEMVEVPHTITKRVIESALNAHQCEKRQEPIPSEYLRTNMLYVFDRKKGIFESIGDLVFGGNEVTVSRDEVARWLDVNGLKSKYAFRRETNKQVIESNHIWPWGNHSTQMLEHLAAAAQRYYGANYDPNDGTTAPTNAAVSEWLHTKRKVSKSMADSIASMLRPDGLPTGPRK